MKRTRLSLEALEARDVPAVDLIVTNVEVFGIDQFAIPGEKGTVRFDVKNVGDTRAQGETGMHIYMGDSNVVIGKVQGVTYNLPAGGSRTFTAAITIPKLNLAGPVFPADLYEIQPEADSGQRISETDEGNNRGFSLPIEHVFRFGDVGDGATKLQAEYLGSDYTFAQSGEGYGEIQIFDPPVGATEVDLVFTGTDKTSFARVAGGGPVLTIRNITSATPLGGLIMPNFDAKQALAFDGGLGTLQLRDLAGGFVNGSLTIGAGLNKPANLSFRRVAEFDISAAEGINNLKAGEWLDGFGAEDNITSRFINSLLIQPAAGSGLSGDFEAGLTLNIGVTGSTGYRLSAATIGGTVRNAVWTCGIGDAGSVDEVTVGTPKKFATAAVNWLLSAGGRVNTLKVYGNWTNTGEAVVAESIGTIAVVGELRATEIRATGKDSRGRAIRALGVRSVVQLDRLTALHGGIFGLLGTDWEANTDIEAKWLGTVLFYGDSPNGDFRADVTLRNTLGDANVPANRLDGFKISGVLSGQWDVDGTAHHIHATEMDAGFLYTQTSGFLGRLVAHNFRGIINVPELGSVEVRADFTGSITVTGSEVVDRVVVDSFLGRFEAGNSRVKLLNFSRWENGALVRIGSLGNLFVTGGIVSGTLDVIGQFGLDLKYGSIVVGASIDQFTLRTPATSELTGLYADHLRASDIRGGSIRSIVLRGSPIDPRGNLTDTVLDLDGQTPGGGGISLQSLVVPGVMSGSTITLKQNAGMLDIGTMQQSDITATGQNIETFLIRGNGTLTGGPFFSGSNVTAQRIRTVRLRNVDETVQTTFGITADSIGFYSRRVARQVEASLKDLDAATTNADPGVGSYRLTIT